MRPGLIALMLASATWAGAYEPPPDFDASDSGFLPDETHSETTVQEAEREGWIEHVDTIRFGDYGLRVVQRLNPETGLPTQDGRRWGDTFVGIDGHKPAAYMSSNWSPWWFLDAEVRLDGADEPLPSPTMRGLLVHCGLREVANDRITGDAVWRDEAGGLLRASFTGWRGERVFGMALRYLPPPGRTASVRWILTAQPYDYSDRGHWQRRRWLTTPARSVPVPEEALALADDEWRMILHNRYAHLTSGCVFALDPSQLAEVNVSSPAPERVLVELVPADPGGQVALVLGDWVDSYWQVQARRLFARDATELQTLVSDAMPPPETHGSLQELLEAETARVEQITQERAARARRLTERDWAAQ